VLRDTARVDKDKSSRASPDEQGLKSISLPGNIARTLAQDASILRPTRLAPQIHQIVTGRKGADFSCGRDTVIQAQEKSNQVSNEGRDT
jgi:hypothetical protein